jgi:hypothetical protein
MREKPLSGGTVKDPQDSTVELPAAELMMPKRNQSCYARRGVSGGGLI